MVRTMQQQQVQDSAVDRYKDKARAVVARLQMQRRQSISASFNKKQTEVLAESAEQTSPESHGLQQQPKPSPSVSSRLSPSALKALVYQAQFSSQASLRKEALEGLFVASRFSEHTIEALETALDDKDPQVREFAARKLASFPPPLTDVLLDKLLILIWDPAISVRKSVATSLAHHPDPRAIGPLFGLLGTPDLELRAIVHDSLVKITELLGPPPQRRGGDV